MAECINTITFQQNKILKHLISFFIWQQYAYSCQTSQVIPTVFPHYILMPVYYDLQAKFSGNQ